MSPRPTTSKGTKKPPAAFTVGTEAAVAAFFNVERSTITSWKRRGMPGGNGKFRLDHIGSWLAHRPKRERGDADPLLDGETSPALERYRVARAEAAELDLEVRRGTLVDRGLTRAMLEMSARIIRECGATLQRAYGRGALDILNEAIDEAERHFEQEFGGGESAAS